MGTPHLAWLLGAISCTWHQQLGAYFIVILYLRKAILMAGITDGVSDAIHPYTVILNNMYIWLSV